MRKLAGLLLLLLAPLAWAGGTMLVSTSELAAEMRQSGVKLVDAENAEQFARAHIPGAAQLHFMDLEDFEENVKNGQPVFAQMAASKFGALGLTRDADVVVYDGGDGRGASALWYLLRYLGHDKVRILDGGFRKWVKEGRPISQERPRPAKATYLPKARRDRAVRTKDVDPARNLVLDARSLAEFTGKELGGARQGGHIPGATAFPWTQLAGDLASFKPAAEMKQALARAGITPDREIITYCNGGLGRSTFLLAALTLLGYEKVKVYPGSWIEWASDPARPIER